MKEQLITFETAKLAKEKGFDWATDKHYENSLTESIHEEDGKSGPFGWEKGEINLQSDYFINNWKECDLSSSSWYLCSAPTQSLLQKFIRENRGVHIEIHKNASGYYWSMCRADGGTDLGWSDYSGPNMGGVWDSFEDALEKGLQESLKLIK